MATYDDLIHGTIYGPVIVPSDSQHGILNMLLEGRTDQLIRMHHGQKPLNNDEIEILRIWLEQGVLNN